MGGGADENIKYVTKRNCTFRERLLFGLTGRIDGDPSKIFKLNTTDMVGKRNIAVLTYSGILGIFVWNKYFKKPKKEKVKKLAVQ